MPDWTITVRLSDGCVKIDLQLPQELATKCNMESLQTAAQVADTPPVTLPFPSTDQSELSRDTDAWGAYLRGIGRKASTIAAYRKTVGEAAAAKGWTRLSQVSLDAVSAYLCERRERLGWTGSTFNRNMAAFTNLTRWAKKTRRAAENVLEDVDHAKDSHGAGVGPLSLLQVERLMSYTTTRQALDKRSRTNRVLYWYWLILAGMRFSEPAAFRWKNLLLSEEIPLFSWEGAMQKNGKRCEIAIHPALVPMILAHRETVPHEPNDPVFPGTPARETFRADCRAAGIPAKDSRGRPLSCHSARKFFRSHLAELGASGEVIDYLMRHARGVSDRYNVISPVAQVAVLSMVKINIRGIVEESVANGGEIPNNVSTTEQKESMHTISYNPALTTGEACKSSDGGTFGDKSNSPVLKTGLEESGDDVATTKNSVPLIDLVGRNSTAALNLAVANVLRATADLLEKAVKP